MTPEAAVVIRPADIDLAFTPARSSFAVQRVVDDDMLLLDPESGSTHALNPIGSVFWSALDGRTSLQELTEDLADAVDVPVEDLIAPVLGWARSLGFNGLLDGVAPSEADLLGSGAAVSEGESLPVIVGKWLATGETVRLPELRGRRTVIVNWSFGCGYCLRMIDALQETQQLLDAQMCDVTLVVAGAREDVEAAARSHGLADSVVLTDPSEADDGPFHDLGTPAAYVVDGDGAVSEPLAYGGDEVPAALRRLAGLPRAPVGPIDVTVAPDPHDGEVRYLAPPPSAGVCAPSAAQRSRTWTAVDTFRIGDLVVGIRAASSSAADVIRRLLAGSAYEGAYRLANYSVVLPFLEDASTRELNLLLCGDGVIVRSRSARRIVDGLLAYLSAHVAPEESDVWRIAALPVVRDGRAVLLPDDLRSSLARVQPRLAKAGLSMVDLPAAVVDVRTLELVVPRPAIPHDTEVASRLGPVIAGVTEPLPAAPGRYPLLAWVFPDPGREAGVSATSLALAVGAVARPKNAALLTDVAALLDRVPAAVGSDLGALIESASELLGA